MGFPPLSEIVWELDDLLCEIHNLNVENMNLPQSHKCYFPWMYTHLPLYLDNWMCLVDAWRLHFPLIESSIYSLHAVLLYFFITTLSSTSKQGRRHRIQNLSHYKHAIVSRSSYIWATVPPGTELWLGNPSNSAMDVVSCIEIIPVAYVTQLFLGCPQSTHGQFISPLLSSYVFSSGNAFHSRSKRCPIRLSAGRLLSELNISCVFFASSRDGCASFHIHFNSLFADLPTNPIGLLTTSGSKP
jgi:hypothetical protein